MLILLFGPSGVGKTAIIDELAKTRGWGAVPSYITRPARLNEIHKFPVCEAQYLEWLDKDLLFTHVSQLGGLYGTMRQDIEVAVNSNRPFLLDFAVEKYNEFFSTVPNKRFVVLPESQEQLTSQLIQAGRHERAKVVADDLNRFTAKALENQINVGYEKLVNRPNKLDDTVHQLASSILNS